MTGCIYFRIHTADLAYATGKPRGIFVAVWKLTENKAMSEAEISEYAKQREWFEENLPVPPFYASGNPDRAITWYKNNPLGMELFGKMGFTLKWPKNTG